MTRNHTDNPPPFPDLPALLQRALAEFRRAPIKGDAYFELVEADHVVIPLLIAAFHAETHPGARALLVDAIWEHRTPDVLDFLADALLDPDPPVWKNALDGFVALGSPEALTRLTALRTHLAAGAPPGDERLLWVDESIRQVAEDAGG